MNLNGTKLTSHHGVRIPKHAAGIATAIEFCIHFVKWADRQPKPLSAVAIQNHWEMSRASAYRWRAAYLACTGQYVETHQLKRGK